LLHWCTTLLLSSLSLPTLLSTTHCFHFSITFSLSLNFSSSSGSTFSSDVHLVSLSPSVLGHPLFERFSVFEFWGSFLIKPPISVFFASHFFLLHTHHLRNLTHTWVFQLLDLPVPIWQTLFPELLQVEPRCLPGNKGLLYF
jgi:hypothetical protein